MTNAEKIRSMNDEELAELLENAEGAVYNDASITPRGKDGFHMDMLEWLKSETWETWILATGI